MTTDAATDAFDFDQVDPERLSDLFTVAIAQHKGRPVDLSELSAEDLIVVEKIGALLQTIDALWEATPSELARGRALFLKKLAAEEPDHPWVRQNQVATLGDLFRESQDDFPSIPQAAVEALSRDLTPIEKLLDVSSRTELVGRALKAAAVPTKFFRECAMGVNRMLGAVSSVSRPQGQGFVYARSQRTVKRKTSDSKTDGHDNE